MILETKSSQQITKQILIVYAIKSNNSNTTQPNFIPSYHFLGGKKEKENPEGREIWLSKENSLQEYLKTVKGMKLEGLSFLTLFKFSLKGAEL